MLTACNSAPLHVAISAGCGVEGGSDLGRSSPEWCSQISAPPQWKCWAHHRSPVLGQHGPPGPAGWGTAPPARVNREVANESGEGIICLYFLLPRWSLGSHCRERWRKCEEILHHHSPPPRPPIIFLSGRKRPHILKHDNSPRLYNLWKNMIRRSLGANL